MKGEGGGGGGGGGAVSRNSPSSRSSRTTITATSTTKHEKMAEPLQSSTSAVATTTTAKTTLSSSSPSSSSPAASFAPLRASPAMERGGGRAGTPSTRKENKELKWVEEEEVMLWHKDVGRWVEAHITMVNIKGLVLLEFDEEVYASDGVKLTSVWEERGSPNVISRGSLLSSSSPSSSSLSSSLQPPRRGMDSKNAARRRQTASPDTTTTTTAGGGGIIGSGRGGITTRTSLKTKKKETNQQQQRFSRLPPPSSSSSTISSSRSGGPSSILEGTTSIAARSLPVTRVSEEKARPIPFAPFASIALGAANNPSGISSSATAGGSSMSPIWATDIGNNNPSEISLKRQQQQQQQEQQQQDSEETTSVAAAVGDNDVVSSALALIDCKEMYREQLATLVAMGFVDEQLNEEALRTSHGNIEAALNFILNTPSELD